MVEVGEELLADRKGKADDTINAFKELINRYKPIPILIYLLVEPVVRHVLVMKCLPYLTQDLLCLLIPELLCREECVLLKICTEGVDRACDLRFGVFHFLIALQEDFEIKAVDVAITIDVHVLFEDVDLAEDWVNVVVVVFNKPLKLLKTNPCPLIANNTHLVLYKLPLDILKEVLAIKPF